MRRRGTSRTTRAIFMGLFVLLGGFCAASALGHDGLIGLGLVALAVVLVFVTVDRMRSRRRH